jgi:hypothetical protein
VRFLLDHGERFGLQLDDVEGLMVLAQEKPGAGSNEPDRRSGAGASGVILSKRGG